MRKRVKDERCLRDLTVKYISRELYARRNLYLRSPHKGRQIAEHALHLVFFAGAAAPGHCGYNIMRECTLRTGRYKNRGATTPIRASKTSLAHYRREWIPRHFGKYESDICAGKKEREKRKKARKRELSHLARSRTPLHITLLLPRERPFRSIFHFVP